MSSILGKRKRLATGQLSSSSEASSQTSDVPVGDLQAVFRRHFEAQFEPLEEFVENRKSFLVSGLEDESRHEDDDEVDWDGLSSQSDEAVVVVEDTELRAEQDLSKKAELRSFMNSKPPHINAQPAPWATNRNEEEAEDKLNLRHDLALQRLINESHILEAASSDATKGHRQKITDMRVQALGAKSSILVQQKMPMSQRKGMLAKAKEREERRRQEAQATGVVLEKFVRERKSDQKRVRAVGGPAVGTFKGGTLRLSRKDVAEIKGPGLGTGLKKRGKR